LLFICLLKDLYYLNVLENKNKSKRNILIYLFYLKYIIKFYIIKRLKIINILLGIGDWGLGIGDLGLGGGGPGPKPQPPTPNPTPQPPKPQSPIPNPQFYLKI